MDRATRVRQAAKGREGRRGISTLAAEPVLQTDDASSILVSPSKSLERGCVSAARVGRVGQDGPMPWKPRAPDPTTWDVRS